MGRRRAILQAFVLLAFATACRGAEPIPPLAHVSPAAKLRVRVKLNDPDPDDPEPSDLSVECRNASRLIIDELKEAGYEVVESGPYDLRLRFRVFAHKIGRHGDGYFSRMWAKFQDGKNVEVERIVFDLKPGAAPSSEPQRVANVLVNAIVESPKLAAYASQKHPQAQTDAPPAPAPAP